MAGLKIAVLVKQVPLVEEMALGPDGRLLRTGVELELNPYCRRAVTKGVELAELTCGTCALFTLGPPAAEDVLREGVAAGADAGVLITDPSFAGSDTLATARALAAALSKEGPFDLVLTGLNSVDADTGQVGAEVAEILNLPFVSGARELSLSGQRLHVSCERDDGTVNAELELPAVVSAAERLCEPAKRKPAERIAVSSARIRRLVAADLGSGPWGLEGSPTTVGEIREITTNRLGLRLRGSPERQVDDAVKLLEDRGTFEAPTSSMWSLASRADRVPHDHIRDDGKFRGQDDGPSVLVIAEPARPLLAMQLLAAANRLIAPRNGRVIAAVADSLDRSLLGSWGADEIVYLHSPESTADEESIARALTFLVNQWMPSAILASSSSWGRHVAARLAARIGAGLTGDAIELEMDSKGLVAWKPAFGGKAVVAIRSKSPVQLVTLRPSAACQPALSVSLPTVSIVRLADKPRVRYSEWSRDGSADSVSLSDFLVGVGLGVDQADYPLLDPLLAALDTGLVGTRKVTDQGWLPRHRQVGLTGTYAAPRLYVAFGISGRFNHIVGVSRAGTVLAVNSDPSAPIIDHADITIVEDWKNVVPFLTDRLAVMTRSRKEVSTRQGECMTA